MEQVDKLYDMLEGQNIEIVEDGAITWMTIWISWIRKARTARMTWTSSFRGRRQHR